MNFTELKESSLSLKIDKDLVEIQRTIIYYGKIIEDLRDKVNLLIKEKDKVYEKTPEEDKKNHKIRNAFISHLRKLR